MVRRPFVWLSVLLCAPLLTVQGCNLVRINHIVEAAARGDKDEVVRLLQVDPGLVNRGVEGSGLARRETTRVKRGWTTCALHEAARNGHLEIVNLLLERGAKVNGPDIYEKHLTPLHVVAGATRDTHLAGAASQVEVIEVLLAHGADVNARDPGGNTPLHWASEWLGGHLEPLDVLITNGAEVNAADDGGWTPLHVAAYNGYVDGSAVLCAGGADDRLRNHEGQTPLQIAQGQVRNDCMILWLEPGGGCQRLRELHGNEGSVSEQTRTAVYRESQCECGHGSDCTNLGVMYAKGEGVPQDYARAAELFARGCRAGSARGCVNLGRYHELGRGVQKDEARAVELYQQSCDDGDQLGCYRLGRMLERGRGLAADVERAVELYRRACQEGRQEACKALERLSTSSEVP